MLRKSLDGLRKRLLRSMAEKIKKGDFLLNLYVERIAEEFPLSTVILFGSRARGDPLPYSDYDIAVIFDVVEDKLSLIEKLRRMKPKGLPLDLLVLSLEEIFDPLIRGMFKDSRILYDGLGVKEKLKVTT